MTSEAPYLHCRLCGIRYRSDQVSDHERQCSYQKQNSRDSSRNMAKDLAPASSKDSRVNELRDKDGYYMQERRSESSEKQTKDLTSNEESDDSPLNLINRRGTTERKSREYREEPIRTHSRSESRTTSQQSTKIGGSDSRPVESQSRTEVKTTYDAQTGYKTRTETKTFYGPDGRQVKKETKTTYHVPESQENESDTRTTSDSNVGNDAFRDSFQNKEKSPKNSTSESREMTENHKRSHSNEKRQVKMNSVENNKEKNSDEEQKAEMLSTPYPSEEDIKIPSTSTNEVVQAADMLENLPELSAQAETAFEQHEKSLVPCTHCERMFRPDRLHIHERACIMRPKAREYIVPENKKENNLK